MRNFISENDIEQAILDKLFVTLTPTKEMISTTEQHAPTRESACCRRCCANRC